MHRVLLGTLLAANSLVVACGGGDDDGLGGSADSGYSVTHLVSDTAGSAKYLGEDTTAGHVDARLKNPWGIAFNPQGFVWVANEVTDTSTLYDGTGAASAQLPVVNLPDGTHPTGIVFSGSATDFVLTQGSASGPARFIFAGLNGTIVAWSPDVAVTEAFAVFTASDGAAYTGLAISGSRLYAADFAHGKVDVFNASFQLQAPSGFTDPNLPADFVPFGIQAIGSSIYVAYAQQDASGQEEIVGAGRGVVNRFDANGGSLTRLISNGSGSVLNAPWGIVQAPSDFGAFSGDLLIGNFGDGKIHAFNPTNGSFLGTLQDANGDDIALEGLWGIAFGNGIMSQPTNALFFAAGINNEANGLYGRITCNGC
jgi:uncharacterized protein (TIGR03118 family)